MYVSIIYLYNFFMYLLVFIAVFFKLLVGAISKPLKTTWVDTYIKLVPFDVASYGRNYTFCQKMPGIVY